MPLSITETNLRNLVDLLVQEAKLVVGPKLSGSIVLYQPLALGAELTLDAPIPDVLNIATVYELPSGLNPVAA